MPEMDGYISFVLVSTLFRQREVHDRRPGDATYKSATVGRAGRQRDCVQSAYALLGASIKYRTDNEKYSVHNVWSELNNNTTRNMERR